MKTVMDGKKEIEKDGEDEKDVIAFRNACDAKGTGLSHYILMDRKKKE